jgi:hypothetical protein
MKYGLNIGFVSVKMNFFFAFFHVLRLFIIPEIHDLSDFFRMLRSSVVAVERDICHTYTTYSLLL